MVRSPYRFLNRFCHFDPWNFQSTSWRNEKMLESENKSADNQAFACPSQINNAASSNDENFPKVSYIQHYGAAVCFMPHAYHYTKAELEPFRKIGDPEMDSLLEHIASYERNDSVFGGCEAFDDVISHSASAYSDGFLSKGDKHIKSLSPLGRFYEHYYDNLPEWVDFNEIQRGIDVFLAYLPAAGCALFYRSLVGGFSIPEIVEVLITTKYLVPTKMMSVGEKSSRNDPKSDAVTLKRDRIRTLERLLDTGGFLSSCFAPAATDQKTTAAALRPGGKGWEAALRVRVLHAKIRRSLLQSKKITSDGNSISLWDSEKNGIPINQEDMAATLLAFSVNVLVGIEFIAGKPLPENEQRDYLALWRYIGWLLGVDTQEKFTAQNIESSNVNQHDQVEPIDPCGPRKNFKRPFNAETIVDDSLLHSYATLESMILHILHPEQKSRYLVAHLLSFNGNVSFRSELCRRFLGDPLSDDLGIPRSHHLVVNIAVVFFLLFLRCYTLLCMSYPSLRKCLIIWHGLLQDRFLLHWEKNNSARVKRAEVNSMPNSGFKKRVCPFSMVMPPQLA